MNLIEQLGGYEEARKQGEEWGFDDHLSNALLEYRRQHNIFEVGDKVVYVDDFMHGEISIVSGFDDRVWLNNDAAVCIFDMVRHATPEEVGAGHRLN